MQQQAQGIITCPNNHILLQTKDLEPHIPIGSLSPQYTCTSCQNLFSRDDSCHFCVLCKFDLCQQCYDIQSNIRTSCPSGHILFKINTLGMKELDNQKPYCRKCKITLDQPSEYPTSCFKCKYDLCSSCTSDYEKQISQLDSSLKYDVAQKHQVGTCDKLHPLVNTEELPSKNFLIWSCLEVQGSPSCLACGFDLDSHSKERSFYSCQACDFDLCSNCNKLSQALNFSCSKGHKLYIVSSLK